MRAGWGIALPHCGREESPDSAGQGTGDKPGRGDPAERATENRPPSFKLGKGEKVV